jgi:hypothetical protein
MGADVFILYDIFHPIWNEKSRHESHERHRRGTIVDLSSEELMNLEITARQGPDRGGFIGGSGGHLLVSAGQAGLIRHWKEEHGEVKAKSQRALPRVRIAGARGKNTTRRLHPISSAVCWLFKPFVLFLNPGSCRPTPLPHPVSGIKTNPAASIPDRNVSTLLSREARRLKSIDGVFTLAAGARLAMLQSRPARAKRP